jgi:hypothetical protein
MNFITFFRITNKHYVWLILSFSNCNQISPAQSDPNEQALLIYLLAVYDKRKKNRVVELKLFFI